MFEQELTPAEQKVLDIFLKSKNSGEVKNRIARYVQSALNEGNALQPRMLGEALTKEQILDLEALHQEQIELYQTMKELDAVSEEYTGDTININSKERPVYNSEGNRIAKSEKALRAFYKWFGDSKVVDSKGRPLVVYHGGKKGIKAFKDKYAIEKGMFFFTDNYSLADEYRTYNEAEYDKTDVYDVYLKIEKPLKLTSYDDLEKLAEAVHPDNQTLRLEWLEKEMKTVSELRQDAYDEAWYMGHQTIYYRENIKEYANKNGYDGIFNYEPTMRGAFSPYQKGYIAFSPNQIKSVDNRGTFDLNDNNIYLQETITDNEMDVANDMRKRLGVEGAIYELEYTKRLFDRNLHNEHPTVVEMTKKRIASLDRQIEWLRGGNQLTVKHKPIDQSMNAKAREYFGTTTNINEAGYIMQDGSMLDFSGKKFGGQAGYRTMDHREISSAFEEDGFNVEMTDFIDNGNIRFLPESKTFLMSRMPTPQQIEQIQKISDRVNGEVIIECVEQAKEWGSDYGFYREYEKGTDFKSIKRDITSFFRTGKVSDTGKFLQTAYVDETNQKDEIKGLVEKSKEKGTFKDSIKLGKVPNWLARLGAENGLDIYGYDHAIDISAIKHIVKKHSNQKAEESRGQIAITTNDLMNIAEIVSTPDYIVFGTKTNQKLDAVVYVKQMPNGTTYYLEEVRKGRKTLTATTMWKKMSVQPTAESIRNSIGLNAQSDTDIKIIPNPNTNVKYEQAVYVKEPTFNPDKYFERKDVKIEIQKSKDNFSKAIDEIESGDVKSKTRPIVLFKPSEIWLRVGLPNRRISFEQSKIRKVMREHNLTSDDLKRLPEQLANPEYIYLNLELIMKLM